MKPSTILKLALPLVLATTFWGCSDDPSAGYTTNSQFSDDVKTISIPIWTRGKDVYRRDIEMRITEAVVKRVQQDTPYRIAHRQDADTELTGELTEIQQRVLHYNPNTGNPQDMEIIFTVSFTWRDLRTGKILMKKDRFQVAGVYIPPSPFNEDFFQGSEDVINQLAKRVVEQMENEW